MTLHAEHYRGWLIKIYQDEFAEDPRESFDNLWTMFCYHKRYHLGDANPYSPYDFSNWGELFAMIEVDYKPALILPLYAMDHGNIVMARVPFQDPWDSGQVGYAFVERNKLLAEYGQKRFTKALAEKALKVLDGEIETYNQWLGCEVYGYRIFDENGEDVDSCSTTQAPRH